MGFFDKVKGAMNTLTGGAAKVFVTVNGNDLKGDLNVTVRAEVKDAPVNITKVYLWVKSVEKINVPHKALPQELRDKMTFNLNLENERFPKREFLVAEAQTLEANQSYTWSIDIKLDGGTASYNGQYATHEWHFYAGLDARGNDPDSGWQRFDLY